MAFLADIDSLSLGSFQVTEHIECIAGTKPSTAIQFLQRLPKLILLSRKVDIFGSDQLQCPGNEL